MSTGCADAAVTFLLKHFKKRVCTILLQGAAHADEQAEAITCYLRELKRSHKISCGVAFLHPDVDDDQPHTISLYVEKGKVLKFDSLDDECTDMWRGGDHGRPVQWRLKFWWDSCFSRTSWPKSWTQFKFSYFITWKGYSTDVKPRDACTHLKKKLTTFEPDYPFDEEWHARWLKRIKDYIKTPSKLKKEQKAVQSRRELVQQKIHRLEEIKSEFKEQLSNLRDIQRWVEKHRRGGRSEYGDDLF